MNSDTVYRMNADTVPLPGTDLPRAGFWRRWFAILIDTIVVMFPFQIVAAILFAVTAGTVQMGSGFFTFCAIDKTIPQGLDPPPPHDSNFARVCKFSFFGATTGAVLTVGRTTREANTTKTVTQGYMVDAGGKQIHGTSIDGIFWLAFLAYLFGMACRTGKTLGARAAKVRLIDVANPNASGVPLGKVIIRYLAMMIGAVPAFAVLIYARVTTNGTADAFAESHSFNWFPYAAALGAIWGLVLIIQIARKTDPVYDRLAGTAVVREASPEAIAAPA
jgi:hypothetical protein